MNQSKLRNSLRALVYPGLDLHLRNRASLCQYWRTGPRDVLDAGSGNGYFSWLAYRSGAKVVAMNFEESQVAKAKDFFLGHLKTDPERLSFEHRNLYELGSERRTFDEIICYETLEHIQNDRIVIQELARLLRPGGTLHLCCPNSAHPRHQREVLDEEEQGGHVRAGYTEADYRALLAPTGLRIDVVAGIGPKSVYWLDEVVRAIRRHAGDIVALPLLPVALPFVHMARHDPPIPFSLYVRAVKDR